MKPPAPARRFCVGMSTVGRDLGGRGGGGGGAGDAEVAWHRALGRGRMWKKDMDLLPRAGGLGRHGVRHGGDHRRTVLLLFSRSLVLSVLCARGAAAEAPRGGEGTFRRGGHDPTVDGDTPPPGGRHTPFTRIPPHGRSRPRDKEQGQTAVKGGAGGQMGRCRGPAAPLPADVGARDPTYTYTAAAPTVAAGEATQRCDKSTRGGGGNRHAPRTCRQRRPRGKEGASQPLAPPTAGGHSGGRAAARMRAHRLPGRPRRTRRAARRRGRCRVASAWRASSPRPRGWVCRTPRRCTTSGCVQPASLLTRSGRRKEEETTRSTSPKPLASHFPPPAPPTPSKNVVQSFLRPHPPLHRHAHTQLFPCHLGHNPVNPPPNALPRQR